MATKPSIPKGTRDFSPVEMAKRNYIFDTIREVFYLYGFQQIETPSMENLSTLMGKYGEEGDKLLFKIQNSGDYFSGLTDEELLSRNAAKLASKFCEKGLRYDLTVPFARYVVMHRDEISFPFKRFQIQPVWRADRPQKGRYREFYQCDADVVGSNSLLNEVELVQMIDAVFNKFGIRVSIKINNRKILTGIAEIIGEADKIVDITVAIDKLDKIGLENVNAELASKGIPQEAIDKLQPIILLSGSNEEKLETLKSVLAASETGLKGVEESEFILKTIATLGIKSEVELAGEQPGIYYGYYFLELADYFGQEGIDEKESMNLLYVTVKALLNPNIDDRLVRCIFELRMMAAQGLCPSLFHCVCCERQPVEGEELFFSQQNHGILDKACLGHVNDAKRISAPALYTMQYIVTASLGKLYTFTVTEEVLHELERHIHTYIAANTEKRFKSLEILEIMS